MVVMIAPRGGSLRADNKWAVENEGVLDADVTLKLAKDVIAGRDPHLNAPSAERCAC